MVVAVTPHAVGRHMDLVSCTSPAWEVVVGHLDDRERLNRA